MLYCLTGDKLTSNSACEKGMRVVYLVGLKLGVSGDFDLMGLAAC